MLVQSKEFSHVVLKDIFACMVNMILMRHSLIEAKSIASVNCNYFAVTYKHFAIKLQSTCFHFFETNYSI